MLNAPAFRAARKRPVAGTVLLPRHLFAEATFARDHGRCVACGGPAADAHHIIERKLWPDGGYYLDNAASLCPSHHLEAEMTVLCADEIRAACGIATVLLPPRLDRAHRWDKWGNRMLPDGTRLPGPLFGDDGCRKILRRAGLMHLFPAVQGDPDQGETASPREGSEAAAEHPAAPLEAERRVLSKSRAP